jgi:hypothetical protein
MDKATGAVRATSGSPFVLAMLIRQQGLKAIRVVCIPQPPPTVAPQVRRLDAS